MERETAFYTDPSESANQQGSSRPHFNFNREDFPKTWFGNNQRLWDALAKRHETDVKVIEQLIGRPLNFSESESIAYWTAKEVQVRSRGIPLGFMFGTYRAYATRKDFRFPFFKPSESFNPNILRVFGTTIAEGQFARVFWQATRFTAYGIIVGPLIGSIITMSWGVGVGNAGRLRDPRTKEMFENIRRIGQERQRMMSSRNPSQPLQPSSTTGYDTNSPTNNEYSERFSPDDDPNVHPSQDSASFTSYEKSTAPSINSASYMPPSGNERRFPQEDANANSRYEQPKNENESSGFFDNTYDDASPTARYPSPSSSGGSAWDRIRAGKDISHGAPSQTRESNNTGQTVSSVSTKADPKSQAQKEFDAALDRERQGRNF